MSHIGNILGYYLQYIFFSRLGRGFCSADPIRFVLDVLPTWIWEHQHRTWDNPWKKLGWSMCHMSSGNFSYGYGSIPINTIFNGMNIHKSQLFWCELQGYQGFDTLPCIQECVMVCHGQSTKKSGCIVNAIMFGLTIFLMMDDSMTIFTNNKTCFDS